MSANTDDLVRWLGEQLDEDERVAQAAKAAWDDGWRWMANSESAGRFISTLDPARVLREIDAKRKLLALHQEKQEQGYGSDLCAECGFGEVSQSYYPCATLRLLALPYADRPGYRAEWRS